MDIERRERSRRGIKKEGKGQRDRENGQWQKREEKKGNKKKEGKGQRDREIPDEGEVERGRQGTEESIFKSIEKSDIEKREKEHESWERKEK